MTGEQLQKARLRSNRTQVQAAGDLGVSQTYLSLLEKGQRPLTEKLKRKAVRSFHLQPTEVPVEKALAELRIATDDQLATDLATLGYKGFSYLKPARTKNPAEVLFSALKANDRDARLVEALPWVVLNYPEMDWDALVAAAKINDLQNRLGYVTHIARRVAEFRKDKKTAALLKKREDALENSRLIREDTLCNSSMTEAEKRWLEVQRPEAARHWRLLTDLAPKSVNNYGY